MVLCYRMSRRACSPVARATRRVTAFWSRVRLTSSRHTPDVEIS